MVQQLKLFDDLGLTCPTLPLHPLERHREQAGNEACACVHVDAVSWSCANGKERATCTGDHVGSDVTAGSHHREKFHGSMHASPSRRA